LKLVVDASVAVAATATPLGFERLRAFELIAPPLLWIEAESVLHAMLWRGEVRADQAIEMRARLRTAPIAREEPTTLTDTAWDIAEEMGWAKTYDANYVALARLRSCRLVTLDARLRRGAHRLGLVVGPTEL
jgi:predicted nucleic acid-binding protein